MATKKILVLGSGMVARPCVEYLVRDPKNEITVACRTLPSAQALTSKLPRTKAIALDVSSAKDLDLQIAAHDIVYLAHPVRLPCRSDQIKELEAAVKEAGIVVLNEFGVDPGVDHLHAIKMIDYVHAKGGKVREFYSYCGSLPAPDCADNPLKFKFSWSPRGALLSQQNSAIFLKEEKVVEIPAKEVMAAAAPYYVMDGYDFVAYPNRDSVPFREFYGDLRYEGNPSFVKALIDLRWLDTEQKIWLKDGMTWAEIWQRMIGTETSDESHLIARIKEVCKFKSEAESERIILGLRWMGVLSSEKATVTAGNVLDTLCAQLEKLMTFTPGERDLVMLQHKFVVEWSDGKMNTFTSTLELLGDPKGYSAMSRAVGVTCGIATQLLLDGFPALNTPGILAPYKKEICDPIRELVEREGVKMVEKQVS